MDEHQKRAEQYIREIDAINVRYGMETASPEVCHQAAVDLARTFRRYAALADS